MNEQNNGQNSEEPKGGRSGKRRIAQYLLVAVILFLALFLCVGPLKTWQQERKNESLRLLAEQQTTEAAEPQTTESSGAVENTMPSYISPINFDELRKVNPDVVAWLKIPGTQIDYPVVHTTDNETYLKKTFEGGQSATGAIYLDCDSDGDMMGSHSIFYGHHMKNKTMFTDIIKFKDKDFFNQHREIILYTPERELHLTTIAALYGNADGEKRRTKFKSQEAFEQYIDTMTKDCAFRELPPPGIERLYSFVTCSYEFDDARTILYAVDSESLGVN